MHLCFLGGGHFLCGDIFSVAIFDYLFYLAHITIYHILPPVKFSPKEKGKRKSKKNKIWTPFCLSEATLSHNALTGSCFPTHKPPLWSLSHHSPAALRGQPQGQEGSYGSRKNKYTCTVYKHMTISEMFYRPLGITQSSLSR